MDVPHHAAFDIRTVAGFGLEWQAYDQSRLPRSEHERLFQAYFQNFPFAELAGAHGFDLGCGSGRWAAMVAPRVGRLTCIDPSPGALAVARRNLAAQANVSFTEACAEAIPLADSSQDFGYCLGVLHHTPATERGLAAAVAKLKPGAPFLLYLYYRFDNRPAWFRGLWRGSDMARRLICRLPFAARNAVTTMLAATIYWPLARSAWTAEQAGLDVTHWPLGDYRHSSFYSMRTDSLDRFGTALEQRFTRAEIEAMMVRAGLTGVKFNEGAPYWVALGRKA